MAERRPEESQPQPQPQESPKPEDTPRAGAPTPRGTQAPEPPQELRQAPGQPAARQDAPKAEEAPNVTGPPGEGSTNPALLSSTEIAKRHYANLPEAYRQSLDTYAVPEAAQFVAHGTTRFQVVGAAEGGGHYVVRVDEDEPKNVMYMRDIKPEQYL